MPQARAHGAGDRWPCHRPAKPCASIFAARADPELVEAQYGSWEKAGEAWQNALVEAGYNYVWCAPESGPTLEAYGMRDALGGPLEPGAVYAVTQDGRF